MPHPKVDPPPHDEEALRLTVQRKVLLSPALVEKIEAVRRKFSAGRSLALSEADVIREAISRLYDEEIVADGRSA